jgi:hypothetical protein
LAALPSPSVTVGYGKSAFDRMPNVFDGDAASGAASARIFCTVW